MFDDEYDQLLTEVSLCSFGGLVFAIHSDPEIPRCIISRLRNDLPERFQFFLTISPEKILLPIYFGQSFEPFGKEPVIFHVVGIESLPQESLQELIMHLQHNREAFTRDRYVLVFWVSGKLEREIFFTAPDFYHWVLGTYDFSAGWRNDECKYIEDNQQREAARYRGCLKAYLERAVWQYENWAVAAKAPNDFVNLVMSRADLSGRFVRLYGKDKEGSKFDLEEMADRFLEDQERSFFALLGDFGTGKSSFALHLYIKCAKRYLQNDFNRIPIFVCLKDYPGCIDVVQLIKQECFQQIGAEYKAHLFQELAVPGKFFFILDGFDEMSSIVDKSDTVLNFRELTKLSFETLNFLTMQPSALNPFNKVLITCRTNYFFSESQERGILSKDYARLYRDHVTKSRFEISRISLALFDDAQIAEFLHNEVQDIDREAELLRIIRTTYNLLELSNRPLLLKMIAATLPEIQGKERILATDLYRAYTNTWIEREDWRSTLSAEQKRHWMWKLASELFFAIRFDGITVNTLRNEIERNFPSSADLDALCYETTTSSFLTRGESGNFRFVHKSFMEYFVAEYEATCIFARKRSALDRKSFNKEVMFFLGNLIDEREEANFTGLDFSCLEIMDVSFSGKTFTESDFSGATLVGVQFRHCSLSGTTFENAKLANVLLEECTLNKASFRKCKFRDVVFLESSCEDAAFQGADFSAAMLAGIKFNASDLSYALFDGALIQKSEFNEAYLQGASFAHATGQRASFIKASLGGCILQNANFDYADFGWASLSSIKANDVSLRYANLGAAFATGGEFVSADLEGANLEAANLSYAFFRGANLRNVRVSNETIVYNADFSGAHVEGTALQQLVDVHHKPDWLHYFNFE